VLAPARSDQFYWCGVVCWHRVDDGLIRVVHKIFTAPVRHGPHRTTGELPRNQGRKRIQLPGQRYVHLSLLRTPFPTREIFKSDRVPRSGGGRVAGAGDAIRYSAIRTGTAVGELPGSFETDFVGYILGKPIAKNVRFSDTFRQISKYSNIRS
jgi:hypothetical protein